jgi:hypothetical protein
LAINAPDFSPKRLRNAAMFKPIQCDACGDGSGQIVREHRDPTSIYPIASILDCKTRVKVRFLIPHPDFGRAFFGWSLQSIHLDGADVARYLK